jgi:hypothetical protein
MALIVADRVQETSTTTGTGDFTLAGAVVGYQTFSSVLSTADTTYYTIADQGGANWEVGLGTFTSPSTLARTTILSSSNAGSAVNFTAGTKNVFITYPAGRSVLRDANANISANAFYANSVTTTASGTVVTLTAASAAAYVVTGSGGQIYQLPDATTLPVGAIFTFNNNQSSGSVTVRNNSGTTVATVQSGAFADTVLVANTPAAGSWETHFLVPSNASWSTNTLDWAGSITSATWNGNTVAVNRGGTGATTLTANNVILGNGTSAVQFVAPGTNGNVLTSNGTTWASTTPAAGPATYVRTEFTATGGQTTFTVAYTVGAVQVYVNGILLNSADYTASNGTSVVLASACLVGDIVEFIAISNGSLSLSAVTVGSTAISGGTSARLLYDNAAVVGETSGITTNGTTLTLAGTTAALASVLTNAAEVTTISATAATGTIAYDITTQSVLYYTSNASANWTVNFRASSGTSLNSALATGQTVTVAFLVTQGATAYYNNVVQVDGSAVTPKYQGGTAWTSGNASSIDIYTYTIVKTGSAAFTVFASQTKFA